MQVVTPYHLVAETVFLAVRGEFGNFYKCLYMNWSVEVEFTVPITLNHMLFTAQEKIPAGVGQLCFCAEDVDSRVA